MKIPGFLPPQVKNLLDFTWEDIELLNYAPQGHIKGAVSIWSATKGRAESVLPFFLKEILSNILYHILRLEKFISEKGLGISSPNNRLPMNDIDSLVRRFATSLYVSMVILTLISRLFYRRFNLHQIILAFIRKNVLESVYSNEALLNVEIFLIFFLVCLQYFLLAPIRV